MKVKRIGDEFYLSQKLFSSATTKGSIWFPKNIKIDFKLIR